MGGHLLPELTSRECNRYLVDGGDIAVLPVGSVEVLGPHLPVGARCFVVEAFAHLLAERVDGVRLPITALSSAQNTFDRAGSVAVCEQVLTDYIRATMDDLLTAGFRRILVITFLDYLSYYTPQEFYEDHNVAAAGINLGETIYGFGRERGVAEDSVVVGALRVLGKHDLAERIAAENKRLLEGGMATPELPEELVRLRRSGVVGFTYPPGSYPILPNPGLSGEAGEELLREAAAALAPAVESLRDYNEFLAKRGVSRGMMWRGWRWTE